MNSRAQKKRRAPRGLDELDAKIARVDAKVKSRLITVAEEVGFFQQRIKVPDMRRMFRREMEEQPYIVESSLSKLKRQREKAVRQARKDDARRKAILGGFIVAQCRHKPEFHEAITDDVRAYLERHKNAEVAEENAALLAPFLDDVRRHQLDALFKPEGKREHQHTRNIRTRRLILLGAWVLDQRQEHAGLKAILRDELDGFLEEEPRPDRSRALLADVLDEPKAPLPKAIGR